MADQQQQTSGGHYSGRNPVPTVKKFIQNLDKDKAERDRKLDEENAARQNQAAMAGDAVPHKAKKMGISGTQQTVTDPTTGNQVVIEDVNKAMMGQVENPTLSVPNANLNKDTVSGGSNLPSVLDRLLTQHSLSRQTPLNRKPSTSTTKTSRRHPTLSLKAPPQMFLFTARRPISSSIPRHLSVMSRHSLRWRRRLAFSASASLSSQLLSARCLAAHSRV
jgi:hypothetical protein